MYLRLYERFFCQLLITGSYIPITILRTSSPSIWLNFDCDEIWWYIIFKYKVYLHKSREIIGDSRIREKFPPLCSHKVLFNLDSVER